MLSQLLKLPDGCFKSIHCYTLSHHRYTVGHQVYINRLKIDQHDVHNLYNTIAINNNEGSMASDMKSNNYLTIMNQTWQHGMAIKWQVGT